MRPPRALLIPLVLLSACASAPPRLPPEALRASLEKAELDFAAAVVARGVDAWVDTFAEDGIMLGATTKVTRGRAAIREAMASTLPKVKLTWHPTVVEVAPSGDMGFTFGPYEMTTLGEEGKPPRVVSKGTFFSVWKRGPDGTWKVAADHGSEEPAKP
jgi:ketosteroid isomerase-like protein